MEIRFEKREQPLEKPDQKHLGFGKYFTDYMFVMDWDQGQEWHDARIVPYGPIEFDPASMVLHYAQETFEGMKAYKTKDGRILLFRPEMNARRFINSNKRLSMPIIEEDDFVQAVTIDDTVYKLHFAYNDVLKSWSMDIRDNQNKDLVRSVRIIPNFPLLSQYKRHLEISGEMVATITTDIQNIGRNDFIDGKANLVYVTKSEVNEILETTV